MDWKIELVAIPVTDVDRAKAFYVDQVGFNADHDYQVTEQLRFVQLTPPGSACSIVLGTGITELEDRAILVFHVYQELKDYVLEWLIKPKA